MCLGRVPFPSPSLPEKLFAHQALEPTPLNQAVPGFPEGLAAVVHRMMRKSPDERYATPMQVVRALEPYAEVPSVIAYREGGTPLVRVPEPKLSPALPPSGQGKAAVVSHHGAEPIPALVKTVAGLEGSETAPFEATETGSGANADLSTALPSSPSSDHEPSDPDFPLFVDLGPEPSLVNGRSRTKPQSAVIRAVSATYATAPVRWLTSHWLWVLAALTTTVMVLAGFLAMVNPFGPTSEDTPAGLSSFSKLKSKASNDRSRTISEDEAAIIVRTEGENEHRFPAQKLLEAMQTAMGARGWVELRNREPLHLTSEQALNFISGTGTLDRSRRRRNPACHQGRIERP